MTDRADIPPTLLEIGPNGRKIDFRNARGIGTTRAVSEDRTGRPSRKSSPASTSKSELSKNWFLHLIVKSKKVRPSILLMCQLIDSIYTSQIVPDLPTGIPTPSLVPFLRSKHERPTLERRASR